MFTQKNITHKNFTQNFHSNKFSPQKKCSLKKCSPNKFSPKKIFTQKNFRTKNFFTESVRLSFVDLRWAKLDVSLVYGFLGKKWSKLAKNLMLKSLKTIYFLRFMTDNRLQSIEQLILLLSLSLSLYLSLFCPRPSQKTEAQVFHLFFPLKHP